MAEALELSPACTLRAAASQVSRDLAGEAVILQINSGIYYGVDGVAARIWQLLQSPTTLTDLHNTLFAEYDVAPDRLDTDLRNLLQRLHAAGLVEVSP